MSCFFRRLVTLVCGLCLLFGAAPAVAETAVSETLNVLLIGVDTEDAGKAGQSDAMILAQIDAARGDVRLVSFLRDLYVAIPGHGKTRLNAAYFHGGEALLRQTLENNFGVRIDRSVTVHFAQLAKLIDHAGGVEIDVAPRELSQLNDIIVRYNKRSGTARMSGVVEKAGLQRLNGKQALSYSRIRKIDSDFARTGRQQQVLSALLTQVQTLSPLKQAALAVAALSDVQTDLSLGDLTALLPLLRREQAVSLRSAHVPFDGAFSDETIDGMMVLRPNLERNRQKLTRFLNEPLNPPEGAAGALPHRTIPGMRGRF